MTTVRPARDADAEAFAGIVGRCWDEYPGCVTDIANEAPELLAPARAFAARGGAAWAAERDGTVIGLIAAWPHEPGGSWEIGKMYVDAAHRGAGAAADLLRTAEAHALAHGAARAVLWSDTRFTRAHGFYEKHSYVRTGPLRALDDRSRSIEFGYAKPLAGCVVAELDVAAADSAVARLAAILVQCVEGGASVSFMPPLTRERARGFWQLRTREVAAGTRVLLAAWVDGVLSGVVSLDCAVPENQPHRADLQKMLVAPSARRRGVGRALLRAAEAAAASRGRWLLVLDTGAGSAGEAIYRAEGWTEAGRIANYALNPDGSLCDTILFWKSMRGRPDGG